MPAAKRPASRRPAASVKRPAAAPAENSADSDGGSLMEETDLEDQPQTFRIYIN